MPTYNYNIRTGGADIALINKHNNKKTVSDIGMLGFSIPCQKINEKVLHTLYSRTFATHNPITNKCVMIAIADTCSGNKGQNYIKISETRWSSILFH
jgi:1,4-dihydroxy-2-naphthoyl-CoA synthase